MRYPRQFAFLGRDSSYNWADERSNRMERVVFLRPLIVLAAVVLAVPASAETAYVTDILRLGFHQAEDTSDRPFRTLLSGTELEGARAHDEFRACQSR